MGTWWVNLPTRLAFTAMSGVTPLQRATLLKILKNDVEFDLIEFNSRSQPMTDMSSKDENQLYSIYIENSSILYIIGPILCRNYP